MGKKTRPRKSSSRQPVSPFLPPPPAPRVMDPRFSPACGEFDPSQFKEDYGWLWGSTRDKEGHLRGLQALPEPNAQQLAQITALKTEVAQLKSLVPKTPAQRSQGKLAVKTDDLKAKFKELKEGNKLQDWMAKRRKRVVQKDRRQLPSLA
eukprot:NODE_6006_length_583_cov_19.811404_g5841_i0.p1 GENE.NODE_6006_length_583_cov_19.811404_g5841_i0~~NODE_6006_length_583_cov_19.811404_g5841_i0.p1  ORF type:complete len:163 (+),score=46.46 NODE_6006_length_583_cov_19.811404_g5841_i0:41-490(+)